MITLNNVSKNFDSRMLLDEVTLSIFPNEKIGLTGPNGAGKSTLFSIVRGTMEPTSGEVNIQKNLKVGYLAQEAHFDSKHTVMQEMVSGDAHMRELIDEKQKLEDANKADSTRYGDILEELEHMGIYEIEHKAEKILAGLGFKEEDIYKPVVQLSGGWQMRTLLAKLLTYQYDILLLDEPTNYLDLEATLWLKDFLSKYQGTFVIISHDKIFLNDVTNYTIILEDGKMTKVKGNYTQYEEQKEINLKTLERQKKVVDKKREQLERFAERFHAQPNKASAVRNKRRMLEKLEEIDIPDDKVSIRDFEFPKTQDSGYVVVSLKDVSKSYGEKKVYEHLDFELTRGQKLCLVGPNGAGKSTLLKMLADVVTSDSGTRKLGHNVTSGYFSQTRLDVLSPNRTVFEELLTATTTSIPQAKARSLLGIFNFRGDDVFKPVSVLSGGEKSRLILAKLLINPPNFVLLDEPTTHLDIDGVEALTRCFKSYEGTLCFISHDLFFIKEIANHIVEVNNGQIKTYPGGLDYYLEKKAGIDLADKEKAEQLKMAARAMSQATKEKKESDENSLLAQMERQHKQALKRLEEIKKTIRNLEKEDQELETETYVKSRILSDVTKARDPQVLKECGQRVKEIQTRRREIMSTINALKEEQRKISK
ncbi:MAG: ATP-binding cassette domain-containing protein [Candidatus Omnitrophica bacterium]|nr:ATP-binding cassette domain-containing protein [Candidatus Omnitrophota bacterium]